MKEYASAEMLGKMLKIKPSTVHHYRRTGMIPSVLVGKHHRFIVEDVFRAIESRNEA